MSPRTCLVCGLIIAFICLLDFYSIAQTKIDLPPYSSNIGRSFVCPVNIYEERTAPGDTFDVIGHNRAYWLKVWRSRLFLRPAVDYSLSYPNAGTVRIKLVAPLQPGEWVAWEKWAP